MHPPTVGERTDVQYCTIQNGPFSRESVPSAYAMAWHRAALRDDQGRQNRIEAVGEDLLTIAATALYAESQERTAGNRVAWDLADEFFRTAKQRINTAIRELIRNDDQPITAIGQRALRGEYPALSQGMIRRTLKDYVFSRNKTPSSS